MGDDIIESSANIFADLGFPPDEAAILQMRADLMMDLRSFIENNQLTQAGAAEILGVSRSRAADLIKGRWEKFSLERLISLATKAGMRVSLKIAV